MRGDDVIADSLCAALGKKRRIGVVKKAFYWKVREEKRFYLPREAMAAYPFEKNIEKCSLEHGESIDVRFTGDRRL